METETQLAPAAGSGIGKMVADYLLKQPDFIENMGQVIVRALNAKTRRWDKDAREFVEDDDCKTQCTAFFGIMAHMEGDPIKRIVHQHLGGTGTVDPLAALKESPALREAAARMLEKAEWRHSGMKAHKKPKAVQAVDAELTQEGPASAF